MKNKLEILKYHILRNVFRTKREVPIFIFGYHKCGTKLLGKIFSSLCLRFGWKYVSVPGVTDKIPRADLVFFLHSQVDYEKLPENFIGIHMVRDPRDVIVSGYLYHKRTTEAWCISKNFQTSAPIKYPQIPNSQMYRTEAWKIDYIKKLNGMSYQEKINFM